MDSDQLLVITGFVSTGKSSCGKQVARKLGREFVDTDLLLEEREGRSVRSIFAENGEAFLRARESELCADLAQRRDLVIATGGGTLVSERNLEMFASAFVVCLDASLEEIIIRVGEHTDRPLFKGPSPRERLKTLFRARREAYARIPVHIDTTGKTVDQVSDEIVALFNAKEHPDRFDH